SPNPKGRPERGRRLGQDMRSKISMAALAVRRAEQRLRDKWERLASVEQWGPIPRRCPVHRQFEVICDWASSLFRHVEFAHEELTAAMNVFDAEDNERVLEIREKLDYCERRLRNVVERMLRPKCPDDEPDVDRRSGLSNV